MRHTPPAFRSVRRKVLRGAAAAALAATTMLSAASGAGAAAPDDDLAPRVYTVTPSSEPGAITGPSTVKVWDPQTDRLIKEVPVPSARPDGLSRPHHFMVIPGRNYAFVMGFAPTSSIKVFDMVSNSFTKQIPTGLGARHLSFNPDGAHAYSANFDGNSISVINLNSLKAEATIPVGKKPNYVEFAKTKSGPRLFVCNFGENTVTVIDAETNQVIKTVTVGDGPFNMAVTHDDRYLITADARTDTATFVDTNTLKVVKQIDIGGEHRTDLPASAFQRLNPRISPDGKWLWIGNEDASAVSVVNIPQMRLEKLIPAGLGADITYFPMGPAHGYAFTTNRYDNVVTVSKLNGDQPPTLVGNIPTSRIGSHYITFDQGWDKAYVSLRPGRAFSVLDLSMFADAGPSGPDAAALDKAEIANIWTGGVIDPATGVGTIDEPDHSQDYTRAGPDMAVYVWFEHGRAHMNSEH